MVVDSLHRAAIAGSLLALLVVGCAEVLGIDGDYHGATGSSGSGGAGAAGGSSGTGGSTSTSGGGASSGSTSATGTGGGGGTGPGQISTVATIAECLEGNGTPDQCETSPGAMWVDTPNWRSFMRFNLDGTLQDKTVTGVTLRLTVGGFGDASSNSTGEVYEVQPFTAGDLLTSPPNQIGGPLVTDQGAAQPLQVFDMPLPTSMVAPNESVFLGIFPVANDGVGYWNLNGPDPPELLIDYQ